MVVFSLSRHRALSARPTPSLSFLNFSSDWWYLVGVPYAVFDDVEARWVSSVFIPSPAVVNAYLADATMVMDAELPTLRAMTDSDTEARDRATFICARMVIRVLSNPDQVRSTQDATGPFSESVTYSTESLAGLTLTAQDKRFLMGPSWSNTCRAFEIDPLAGVVM